MEFLILAILAIIVIAGAGMFIRIAFQLVERQVNVVVPDSDDSE